MPFSDLFPYNSGSVSRTAPNSPGVYRLSYKATDGKYYVFYVGQSEDLEERLLAHLQKSEPNACIRDMVRKATCGFRYAVVRSKRDRDNLEIAEIRRLNPSCNRRK